MAIEPINQRLAKRSPAQSYVKRGTVKVELYATGLHNPSHMEWTQDRRLLVSEHTTGQIKDVTRGGNMRDAKPFATGLEGPASILPLPDGRILVSETWGGRVAEISDGGDISEREPFASELFMPYTLAKTLKVDGSERITVSESHGPFHAQSTEITNGGMRSNFTAFVRNMPSVPGAPGLTPQHAWPDRWEDFAAAGCVKNWAEPFEGDLLIAIGPLGQVLRTPKEGGEYIDLVDEGHLVAWGLQRMGGMKTHHINHRVYAVQPDNGSVVSFDPNEPGNQRFEPPVVQGLNMPTCPRFSEDGETMFVCGSGEGVIWKVTNFLK